MNAKAEIETSEFFAPADIDMVDGLIGQYNAERDKVEQVHEFLSGDGFHAAVGYYIAGTGALADAAGVVDPRISITCVEASRLHCDVLEAKGYYVEEADFLEWAADPDPHNDGVASLNPLAFDRIMMNPPFDQGRWRAHLEAAAGLLAPGGVLVAILPASARGKDLLPGLELSFPATYDNAFPGTSISTTILKARRAA